MRQKRKLKQRKIKQPVHRNTLSSFCVGQLPTTTEHRVYPEVWLISPVWLNWKKKKPTDFSVASGHQLQTNYWLRAESYVHFLLSVLGSCLAWTQDLAQPLWICVYWSSLVWKTLFPGIYPLAVTIFLPLLHIDPWPLRGGVWCLLSV